MSDNNKRQALKILSSINFPAQSIQNQKMIYAYNSQMLKATTPKKRKEFPPDRPSTSGSCSKMKKRKPTT